MMYGEELSPEAQCPNCGSYKTQKEHKSSLGYGKRKQYVCMNCYNVFQSEYTPQQIRGFNESKAKEDWKDFFLDPEKWAEGSTDEEATEGGLGSGRKDHQPWMREITQLKTNKHKIPSENMTGSKFLKEMATENSMCGDCMDNFLIKASEDFWDVDSSYGVKSKDELVHTRLLLDKMLESPVSEDAKQAYQLKLDDVKREEASLGGRQLGQTDADSDKYPYFEQADPYYKTEAKEKPTVWTEQDEDDPDYDPDADDGLKASEDDPDPNDPDFLGFINEEITPDLYNKVQTQHSQYTYDGFRDAEDEMDRERGDLDFDSLESKATEDFRPRICPACRGKGCGVCDDTGFVSKQTFEELEHIFESEESKANEFGENEAGRVKLLLDDYKDGTDWASDSPRSSAEDGSYDGWLIYSKKFGISDEDAKQAWGGESKASELQFDEDGNYVNQMKWKEEHPEEEAEELTPSYAPDYKGTSTEPLPNSVGDKIQEGYDSTWFRQEDRGAPLGMGGDDDDDRLTIIDEDDPNNDVIAAARKERWYQQNLDDEIGDQATFESKAKESSLRAKRNIASRLMKEYESLALRL